MLIGITKVRNESLILEDTLSHILEKVDHVCLLDDASTDNTVEIAKSFDDVTVIQNLNWNPVRDYVETHYRAIVLQEAVSIGADWVLCFDADERFVDPLPELSHDVDAYRLQLFDGYMTRECSEDYTGGRLQDTPRMWGVERRDITMLFRARGAKFIGLDQREPVIEGGKIITANSRVMHFGKCISKQQYEDTCRYYMQWPKYAEKWTKRLECGALRGELSDFGTRLVTWEETLGWMNGQGMQ